MRIETYFRQIEKMIDACPVVRLSNATYEKRGTFIDSSQKLVFRYDNTGHHRKLVTAKAEYGVSRDLIVKGIQTGKLEYRNGAIWGNPYLRVLRRQLEKYIAEEVGEDYLRRVKNQTELRRVKKEMSDLKKRLDGLQERKHELESSLGKGQMTNHRTKPFQPTAFDCG